MDGFSVYVFCGGSPYGRVRLATLEQYDRRRYRGWMIAIMPSHGEPAGVIWRDDSLFGRDREDLQIAFNSAEGAFHAIAALAQLPAHVRERWFFRSRAESPTASTAVEDSDGARQSTLL